MNIVRWILILLITNAFFIKAAERLELIHAGVGELIKMDGREIRVLKGDVFFRQGEAYLRCQRALFDDDIDHVTLYQNVEIYDGEHRLFGDRVIYEGKVKIEKACGNVRLEQEGQILTADSAVYHQETRQAHAIGNVHMIDYLEKATLIAQDVQYDRVAEYGTAIGHPKIVKQDTSSLDSLIIIGERMEVWGKRQLATVTDSVQIEKGDMKAYCKYAKFFTDKEQLSLYKSPRMIEQNRHIRGDSIQVQLSASNFESGIIWGNAVVTSVDSIYENVLNGKIITIQAKQDSLRTVTVDHQAENIYHVFNDAGEMEGVNNINGDRIVLQFSGKKLTYVRVESDPGESRGKFIPANMPKAKEEL
ncbi:hypothetical protein JW835_11565 [bacterium]|nr:hypothetical protein [bacterium]